MTEPLSPERLARIEARRKAATDGPWELYPKYGPDFVANASGAYLQGVGTLNFGEGDQADADRAFVLNAPADIELLLAEVYRLRNLVSDANEMYRCGYATGRSHMGADGWLLQQFTAVMSLSDGSDRPVSELRCSRGHLIQRVGPCSLLDLNAEAARHNCTEEGGNS